jgi:hypothetical protein
MEINMAMKRRIWIGDEERNECPRSVREVE